MNKLTIDDLELKGKRVLVRVDFNVPIENGKVTDDTRIVEALPTIKKILDSQGKAILMSHLGRPKGKPVPEFSLAPVARRLAELLEQPVAFASDCVGVTAEQAVNRLSNGECLLLENLRFHPEEEKNDQKFAAQLAKLGDVYVNDAFGSAHRAHSSTTTVAKYFKAAVAGYLMQKELRYLGHTLANPSRPLVAILGGAKVSDKIAVIDNLLNIVDALLIGGGMAFTFLKAQGKEVGASLVEDDKIGIARDLLNKASQKKISWLLPVDFVVADKPEAGVATRIADVNHIPSNQKALDIGPKTIELFNQKLDSARTILWNGPLGVFEVDLFARGTFEVAKKVAEVTSRGATSIIGGGDSAAAVARAGVAKKISHISTGGGASLEFLEGKVLPGVASLTRK